MANHDTRLIPQRSHPRLASNNFDLLRLLFASAVLVFHAAGASGLRELVFLEKGYIAAIAVKAFFVVSGFLIFMSYERSSSLASYASKRVKRIYPAYFTVVMLCALLMVLLSTHDWRSYFFSEQWLRYLGFNLMFLNFAQPTLPGVFEANPEPFVNASLWTLKIEAMFYVSVPILVYLMRSFNRVNPILAFFYFGGLVYAAVCAYVQKEMGIAIFEELGRQLPGQMPYFMAGAFFYYNLPLFERYAVQFAGMAVAVLLLDQFLPLAMLQPFALATLVIFAALYRYLGNFGKYGDFSYGVYILHFPIAQTLSNSGAFADAPWLYMGAVITLTGVGAILMWHLIEKRFLAKGPRRVRHAPAAATADIAPAAVAD